MADTTTYFDWPYPDSGTGVPNNVPSDIRNLAEAADASLKAVQTALEGEFPVLDSTAADVSASNPGDAKAAGATGKAADAGHVHARETTAVALAGPADLTVYSEKLTVVSAAGTAKALDLSAAREFALTLTAGNCTLMLSNPPGTANVRVSVGIRLTQDATGSRTVTWPGNFNWGSAGAPTLTTTANKGDFVSAFTDDAGSTWVAFLAGQGF